MTLNPAFIGRTEFEDVNGHRIFVADWALPLTLRPLEVTASRGVFAAHRQNPDGGWVYRWVRERTETETQDPYLTNLRDEPRPEKPPLTLTDVRLMLLGLIKDGNKDKGMVKTRQLVPIAELLKELEKR